MAQIKTQKNNASVEAFLNTVEDEQKRKDSFTILQMMKQVSKEEPKMWGTSIVGFGTYHYKSERSRQEGDWFITGFSPRKQNLTLYLMPGVTHYKELVDTLGKYKIGGSCLYIKKLSDVDPKVLKQLIAAAYKNMNQIVNKK
jgi:hypothetical protein